MAISGDCYMATDTSRPKRMTDDRVQLVLAVRSSGEPQPPAAGSVVMAYVNTAAGT